MSSSVRYRVYIGLDLNGLQGGGVDFGHGSARVSCTVFDGERWVVVVGNFDRCEDVRRVSADGMQGDWLSIMLHWYSITC